MLDCGPGDDRQPECGWDDNAQPNKLKRQASSNLAGIPDQLPQAARFEHRERDNPESHAS
jgi:hypothetical protein